jgi:(R,R)-butanediol dehydrogenase / meso-butanediol dehydrogenase / diacetyl reductase
MKAAVYYGPGDVRIESVREPPEPVGQEVRLHVTRAAICGTDASEYAHGPHLVPLERPHPGSGHVGPVILGHEFVGSVEAVGPDVQRLRVGQRVVPGAGMWCGECRWCGAGRTNLCRRYYTLGLQADGGLAEYVNAPERMCREVPESCTNDAAAMAQPMAVALHATRRARVGGGMSVAIIGVGGIGLFILASALLQGAEDVTAIDVNEQRLARARRFGAAHTFDARKREAEQEMLEFTDGTGFDVVVEASGAEPSPSLAQRTVRRGGIIALVGLQAAPRALDLSDLTLREVEVVTSVAHVCDVDLPASLDALTEPQLAAAAVDRLIALDSLVDEGLEPLVRGDVLGKILVAVQ